MGYILGSDGQYLLDSYGVPLTDSNPFPNAYDMILQSLRKIGSYASNETLDDDDSQQGLTTLNDMMDSWSNESLSCFAILEQKFTLVVGKSSYSIGPGGDINQPRPLSIQFGTGTCYLLDQNGNKYPVEVVTRDKWNLITQPNITSDLPGYLFYDPQFNPATSGAGGLGVINMYPTPNISYPCFFDSYETLVTFPSLKTPITLPQGYKKAIQDNLAIELCPFFKPDNFQIPAKWIMDAQKSKGLIKRTNIRLSQSVYDPEIVAKPRGSWNIYTNSYNR